MKVYFSRSPVIYEWTVSYQQDVVSLEVDYDKISDTVKKITDLTDAYCYTDPRGRLMFTTSRGLDKSYSITLEEGVDCDIEEIQETLPLITKWKVIGKETDGSRIEAEYMDPSVTELYGELESVYIDESITTLDQARSIAQKLTRESKIPAYNRKLLEVDEYTNRISVGDQITLDSEDLSVSGSVTVERCVRTMDRSEELLELYITKKQPIQMEKIKEIDKIKSWFK